MSDSHLTDQLPGSLVRDLAVSEALTDTLPAIGGRYVRHPETGELAREGGTKPEPDRAAIDPQTSVTKE